MRALIIGIYLAATTSVASCGVGVGTSADNSEPVEERTSALAGPADGGATDAGSGSRHLYPNYLGNNPGNQGRNHSHGE